MGEIPGVRDGAVKDGEGGDGKGSGFDLLNYLGFVWAELSATEVSGSLLVKPNSSQFLLAQPFGVLHGGVTAFLAESLASFGAGIASAPIGAEDRAKAVPLRVGKNVQVWDVKFTTSKSRDSSPNEAQEFTTIAVARLILIVGRPAPIRLPKVLEDLLALSSRRKAESVSHVPKL
uniref:Thioesterase domain-containing protein n=1 Tax=Physcomitrium patens TaxID=3218 RepID=A0A2K1IGM7_PHYPA|nr:hypothetical protein PHYPA_029020 [Physcomitrium patens]